MNTYTVLEYAPAYGAFIKKARRFTEDEKPRYAQWYQDYGFVGLGAEIALDSLRGEDIFSFVDGRPPDGEFMGCANSGWIITDDEKEKLIALNEKRRTKKAEAERAERVAVLEHIIARCEAQSKLYTEAEAAAARKQYNDLHNEGGYGYVPHFYTVDEYADAKKELAELVRQ